MIRLDTLGRLALHGADGREVRSVLAQPKRLALLVYLTLESADAFQRRDHLFGLFWPDLSQSHARQALRQSLYVLRRSLGVDVVTRRGAQEIGIVPEAIACDARTFDALVANGQLEEALACYRGDFLTGFYIAGASSELEEWIAETRDRLRATAVDAAWRLARELETQGHVRDAVRWARFAATLDVTDERSLQRLVRLLDRHGDRAGALRAYADFAQRIEAELDAEPSPETRALIEAIRRRTAERDTPLPDSAERPVATLPLTTSELAATPVADAAARVRPRIWGARASPRSRRRAYLAAGLPIVAAAALAAWPARHARAGPVLAVGWIQDPTGADTATDIRAIGELLSTDLARVPGLRVISRDRMHDLLGQRGVTEATPSAVTEAARGAGANTVLEAVLATSADHALRLDMRRVELATGVASATYTVRAPSVFMLADRATAIVADEFGLRPPTSPVSSVTTTSLAAERLYEQGLRTFYQNDQQAAIPLFHAALSEDSSFAMAAYYAGLAEQPTDGVSSRRDLALALRLADRVSDRERLLIRQAWAFLTNAPTQLALAESLAARYPGESGSELALGRALQWHGAFLEALPHLQRAVAMDSLSLSGRSSWCRACDALDLILDDLIEADSLRGAERVARWWTQRQPASARAWWRLEAILNREEAYDAARVAERTAERLSPMGESNVVRRVVGDIRAGRFGVADRMLADETSSGNVLQRSDALWWLIISLRDQGRLRAAEQVAALLVENSRAEPQSFSEPSSVNAIAIAQVQFELGHYARAAALFDSVADYSWRFTPGFPDGAPGLRARHRIWMETHAATAYAAAGDTIMVGALADSIARWKRASALFRDQVLDHYVHGLLLLARGDSDGAVLELRRAIVSPIDGYSRANYELAQVLIARGRARDAIPLLRAPLHGWLEASNYYVPYTELHALLAVAFDSAGEPDSALVHYGRALDAWQHADPQFATRIATIRARVKLLRARRAPPR